MSWFSFPTISAGWVPHTRLIVSLVEGISGRSLKRRLAALRKEYPTRPAFSLLALDRAS